MEIRHYISCIALVAVSAITASAQQVFTLEGKVIMMDLADSSRSALPGASIEVWCDDTLMNTYTSDERGRYVIALAYFKKYRVRYGGGDLVTKMVDIDASDFEPQARMNGYRLLIDVDLFNKKGIEGLEFLQRIPVARASYSAISHSVDWNIDEINEVDQMVMDILKQYQTNKPEN